MECETRETHTSRALSTPLYFQKFKATTPCPFPHHSFFFSSLLFSFSLSLFYVFFFSSYNAASLKRKERHSGRTTSTLTWSLSLPYSVSLSLYVSFPELNTLSNNLFVITPNNFTRAVHSLSLLLCPCC
jgi:hypothetical protein